MPRAARLLLAAVLCLLLLPVSAAATDPQLVDIYNTLFQTNLTAEQLELYRVAGDQVWGPMVCQVRAQAMFAESNSVTLGTYSDLGAGTLTSDLFSITGRGYLNGQPRVNLNMPAQFGLYALAGAYPRKYSEDALNPGGADNLHTYASPYAGIYMLAWEETDNLTDGDFNDLVVSLRVDTPPVAVAATVGSGPFPAAPNHRAQVGLDGGGSSDADGDPLTYHWSWPGGAATGQTPTVGLPEGDTTVTLIVNDGIADSAPSTLVVSVSPSPNQAPVAEAGQDQTVAPELDHYAQVTLNGSASQDPNEDALTYEWTWAGGSASGVSPTVPLFEGQTYTISLRVYDGALWSAPDTCLVTVSTVDNVAPVATAPPDVTVHAGQDGVAHVPLTAYGYDANSDPLTYDWSWSGGSASGQTITADLPEDPVPPVEPVTYAVSVQAFDALAYSQPDTCQVVVLPAKPVADAGADPAPVSAELNHKKQVSLDGSQSYSRYGLPLTYRWTWPPNMQASGPSPAITVNEGQTTVTLVVNDGSYDSEPDTLVVDILPVPNYAPEADAGADQTVTPALNHRAQVQLDGSGSWDPNQDPLTCTWTWTDLATLQPKQASGATPQVSLYEGVNTITLHVSDGEFAVTDEVAVTVTPVPNLAPVADAGADASVLPRLDRTGLVQLDGSGSFDENQDPLTYTWTWTDIVTGQPQVEHGVQPTLILPIGQTVVHLVVNDGQVNSTNDAAVTVTVLPLRARVPADFATVQAAVDYCQDGDTVAVARGTYTGAVNFSGKAITVEGETGWEDTTLQMVGGGSVVTFAGGEGPAARLRNLTIKGGLRIDGGAGIRIENASPTIFSCRLTGNSQGGAVYITGAGAAPRLANLLLDNNAVSTNASALWVKDGARPVITSCTITGNISGGGASTAAIVLDGACQAEFRDCLIWGNSQRNLVNSFTASTFSYCDYGPGGSLTGPGNISLEPKFKGGSLSSYYLKQIASGQLIDSPCVDAGSTSVEAWAAELAAACGEDAAELLAANTRRDGRPDIGTLDIGFHHHPRPVHVLRVWVTDSMGGSTTTKLFRNTSYRMCVEYRVEGKGGKKYKALCTTGASGYFSLNTSGTSVGYPGVYEVHVPFTVPSFSMPYGQLYVPAQLTMTVKVKQKGTTTWLGQDSVSTQVSVY